MSQELTEAEKVKLKKARVRRLNKEKKKLKELIKDLDEAVREAAENLVENASFMAITLQDLQETISENGCISEYKNGENQYGTKKSPEVEVYNTMIKNYNSTMKQIIDLLPKEQQQGAQSSIIDFIKNRHD